MFHHAKLIKVCGQQRRINTFIAICVHKYFGKFFFDIQRMMMNTLTDVLEASKITAENLHIVEKYMNDSNITVPKFFFIAALIMFM
jgi:hypothetical protein